MSKHYASTGQLAYQPSTSQATIDDDSDSEEHNGVNSPTYDGYRQTFKSRKGSHEQDQDHTKQPKSSQKRLRMNENLQSSSREWKFSSMREADAYLTSHGNLTILEIANKYLLSQGHRLFPLKGQRVPFYKTLVLVRLEMVL